MTPSSYLDDLDTLADVRSGNGYLSFIDHVVVDAQPEKRVFADIAEGWQWERAERSAAAVDHLCGLRAEYDGPRSFWEEYHKGSDKTHEDARQLLFVLGWSTRALNCYVCAGSEDQAALITTAMRGICRDNPWIGRRVSVSALTARGVSGSTLTVLPKNAYGGQGIFPDYVVASEVTHWQHDEGRKMWEFVLESVNKRPQCVLKVETNAGLKGSWQWAERERVRVSKFWSFYSAPVGKPLPTWMDQDKIDDDSQGLTPGERDRLYKNRWVDPGEEHGYLTEAEALLCRDPLLEEKAWGDRDQDYVAVIDYGGVYDRCALCVMHAVPATDRAVVDRLDCWQGTRDDRVAIDYDDLRPTERSVEGWLKTVLRQFRRVTLVVDPHQLEGLAIKYERRGVRVERFEYRGGKGNYRLAQMLKTAVQNRKVSWSPTAGLLPPTVVVNGRAVAIEDRTVEQELAMLVTKPMSYGYRIDHEAGRHDDRCLAADTLIETKYGPVYIDNIRVGDEVLTRRGWRKVLWAGATGYRPTFEVEFSNGTTLRGTDNHPILNQTGDWVPIGELNVGDLAWSLSRSLSTPDGPTDVTRSRNGVTTGSISSVTTSGNRHRDTYIEICGSTLTDQYPTGTTFTTRTTTPSTTFSPIWNALLDNSTSPNTGTRIGTSDERGYEHPTGNETGNNQPQTYEGGETELPTTKSPRSRRRRGKDEYRARFDAACVKSSLTHTSRRERDSVLVGVTNAPSANVVRIVSVRQSEDAVVYDLTVDDAHEFFANGILVHNSVVLGMGLCHCLPTVLPDCQQGPTVVVEDRRDDYKPPGVVRSDPEDRWNERRPQPTGLSGSVGRWNLFGTGRE